MTHPEGASAAPPRTNRTEGGPRVSRLAFVLSLLHPARPVALGVRPRAECIALEDCLAGKVGELPPGWKLRPTRGAGCTRSGGGGRRYLHAASQGLGIQAAKELTWDLARYPVLTWAWRPVEFPTGADERNSKTNDSAVAVYGVFPHRMGSVRSVKYVWSAVVPIGTRRTEHGPHPVRDPDRNQNRAEADES